MGNSFQEVIDVEEDSLEIVGGLLEVAGTLEQTGLVIEDGGDDPSLDSLAASCRIL